MLPYQIFDKILVFLRRLAEQFHIRTSHFAGQLRWATQTARGYVDWCVQISRLWLKDQWFLFASLVSSFFNRDLKIADKILQEHYKGLEQEWSDGSGHIEGEEVFNALSDEEIAWAWQVVYDEYRQELDRWATRIDRSSTVATSTSVVLAIIIGAFTSALFSPVELNSNFNPLRFSYTFLIGIFHVFSIISFISLVRCVHLSLSVLETGQSTRPAFEEVLVKEMVKGTAVRARKIRSGRLLLYAAARNSWETSRRFNILDAAVRHQQDGLASLLAAGVAWLVHWMMSTRSVFLWFDN